MIHNIVKYTIGLPFLITGTVIFLTISFGITIIEVMTHILRNTIPYKNNLIKEVITDLWRPIK